MMATSLPSSDKCEWFFHLNNCQKHTKCCITCLLILAASAVYLAWLWNKLFCFHSRATSFSLEVQAGRYKMLFAAFHLKWKNTEEGKLNARWEIENVHFHSYCVCWQFSSYIFYVFFSCFPFSHLPFQKTFNICVWEITTCTKYRAIHCVPCTGYVTSTCDPTTSATFQKTLSLATATASHSWTCRKMSESRENRKIKNFSAPNKQLFELHWPFSRWA